MMQCAAIERAKKTTLDDEFKKRLLMLFNLHICNQFTSAELDTMTGEIVNEKIGESLKKLEAKCVAKEFKEEHNKCLQGLTELLNQLKNDGENLAYEISHGGTIFSSKFKRTKE
ncbi:hypothetical protein HYV10_00105 [Candidatus Dependentiae bacterium]|nr:hypothetical protein [Candidatus Dependentiae bacterium]